VSKSTSGVPFLASPLTACGRCPKLLEPKALTL
jgi:hypothetical protein